MHNVLGRDFWALRHKLILTRQAPRNLFLISHVFLYITLFNLVSTYEVKKDTV